MAELVPVKVIAVGDEMCGKTFMLTSFNDKYKNIDLMSSNVPCNLEWFKVDVRVGSKQVRLSFFDTNSFYERLRPLAYPNTDVVLMCVSIDNPDSLKNIAEVWAPEIESHCPNIPVILIGTKVDLRNDYVANRNIASHQKQFVTRADGCRMANRINAKGYIEYSAKTRQGINEILQRTAESALKIEASNKLCQIQ